MTNEIQDKIAKVYALVNSGATEGEKQAAKAALDRLMRKYKIDEDYVKNINLKFYDFQYSTMLDLMLFMQLIEFYFPNKEFKGYKSTNGGKRIVYKLEYLEYVQIDCSYHYFKIHMSKQFKIHCAPHIARCRTNKTRNEKRKLLQEAFFGKYIIASKLYHEHQVHDVDLSKISEKERNAKKVVQGVEGGTYNNQVTTGLYLEQ